MSNTKLIKKTSQQWSKESAFKIIDPDGWDRNNYEYSFHEEKITRLEFERRLTRSSIEWKPMTNE